MYQDAHLIPGPFPSETGFSRGRLNDSIGPGPPQKAYLSHPGFGPGQCPAEGPVRTGPGKMSTMKKTSASQGGTKKKPVGGTGKRSMAGTAKTAAAGTAMTPAGRTGKRSMPGAGKTPASGTRDVAATVIPVAGVPVPIRVKRLQGREWAFDLAPGNPGLDAGCELLDEGQIRKAHAMFERAFKRNPGDIDALHHLAVVLDQNGNSGEARRLWTDAVRLGREAIPAGFQKGRDRLRWGWLENRPYLRALQGLGCSHLELGKKADALAIFEEILDLNPDDNQGVRELALEQYLEAGQMDKAQELVNVKYKDDAMAGLLYGRPLVLFKTGDRKRAEKELKAAVRLSPKIAAELLKSSHRRPINELPGYITMGGWDEAFEYWAHFGRFWDKDALDWLRNLAAGIENPQK